MNEHKKMIMQAIYREPLLFPDFFIDYIEHNLHVYDAFEAECFKVIRAGKPFYSARTIVEILRHHSVITETETEYKLNNNNTPYLARLFVTLWPMHLGFFKFREQE